jgi:hypothetical protein
MQSDLILVQCYFATNKLSKAHRIYIDLLAEMQEKMGNANFIISNCQIILDLIRLSIKFEEFHNAEKLEEAVRIVYRIEKRCPKIELWRGKIEENRQKNKLKEMILLC